MNENKKTVEELIRENEILKKTIEVQNRTISNLLNKYVLNRNIRRVKQ